MGLTNWQLACCAKSLEMQTPSVGTHRFALVPPCPCAPTIGKDGSKGREQGVKAKDRYNEDDGVRIAVLTNRDRMLWLCSLIITFRGS